MKLNFEDSILSSICLTAVTGERSQFTIYKRGINRSMLYQSQPRFYFSGIGTFVYNSSNKVEQDAKSNIGVIDLMS